MKPNIKDLSPQEFEGHLARLNQPAYRARQIWQWLYQKQAVSVSEMTNLPASLRAQLDHDFSISRLSTLRRSASRDGAVKFLFGLNDDNSIESVLIPEAKRLTLCISTQAGCGLGCAFCATALLGLKRNLRASEIVDQVLEASRTLAPHPSFSLEGRGQEESARHVLPSMVVPSPSGRGKGGGETAEGSGEERGMSYVAGEPRITHVVLMGMGEPLANYAETLKALEVMTDSRCGLGISPRRITLSTVGLVPQIRKLMEETRVNLAISLHAPTNELRGHLMPVNRKYSLEQLMDCCRSLPIPRRKRITFEYVLLRGVNDSVVQAEQLCELLRGIRCKVNVIPFNPHAGNSFQRPSDFEIERFQQVLQSHGLQVNVRRARGEDIQAACGQLQGEEFLHSGRSRPLCSAEAH